MQTLCKALDEGRTMLTEAGIPDADLDAWLLLEYATGVSRAAYYAEPAREITPGQYEAFLAHIHRRSRRIPLQHITGEQEFMGLVFKVNDQVLVPRQDTELLAEEGLNHLQDHMQVLDLCTGSGCIIISLAKLGDRKACRGCTYTGADISGDALRIAEENAKAHQVDVRFIKSDLFADMEQTQYDMILSNPPYIRTEVIKGLEEEVRLHDPYIALDGKEDGLYFYRAIIQESMHWLKPGGWLLFEIGHDQKEEVASLMQGAGFTKITAKKDLAGLDRVVMGMYNKK